ncbi:MAG: hypothetical protein GY938_31245 [Ketobacter sp.]|nr:hypothetical protein [Ketobacter sp.]
MTITVKETQTPNHYIVVDGSKETVINAASKNDALNKYNNVPVESNEQILLARWGVIRYQRDQLMQSTDWTQIPDASLSNEKKTEFTVYRQALRDIPQTYDNPDDVVWPEKPTI